MRQCAANAIIPFFFLHWNENVTGLASFGLATCGFFAGSATGGLRTQRPFRDHLQDREGTADALMPSQGHLRAKWKRANREKSEATSVEKAAARTNSEDWECGLPGLRPSAAERRVERGSCTVRKRRALRGILVLFCQSTRPDDLARFELTS